MHRQLNPADYTGELPVGVCRFTPSDGGPVQVFESFERDASGKRLPLWHNGGLAKSRLSEFGPGVEIVHHGFRSRKHRD